jgi:hypothetical protein
MTESPSVHLSEKTPVIRPRMTVITEPVPPALPTPASVLSLHAKWDGDRPHLWVGHKEPGNVY